MKGEDLKMTTTESALYFALDSDKDGEPVLEAIAEQATRWNGWRVPVVTFEQFKRFVAEWRAIGKMEWGEVYIDPMDGSLVVTRTDLDSDEWDAFSEITLLGQTAYALEGWVWVATEKPQRRRDHLRVVR